MRAFGIIKKITFFWKSCSGQLFGTGYPAARYPKSLISVASLLKINFQSIFIEADKKTKSRAAVVKYNSRLASKLFQRPPAFFCLPYWKS